MSRTGRNVWFSGIVGCAVAVVQFLMMRRELWPQLRAIDWFILALLLVAPLVALRQHLRDVREMTDDAWRTGIRLALGGYVPLWFGLGLVRRVLNG